MDGNYATAFPTFTSLGISDVYKSSDVIVESFPFRADE